MNSEAMITINGFDMTTSQWNDADYLNGVAAVGVSKAVNSAVAKRLQTLQQKGKTPTPGVNKTPEVIRTISAKVRHNLMDTIALVNGQLEYNLFPATPLNTNGEKSNYGRMPLEYALTKVNAIKIRIRKTALDNADMLELAAANVVVKKGTRDILKAPLIDFIGLEANPGFFNVSEKLYYKQTGEFDLGERPIVADDNETIKVIVRFKGLTALATIDMSAILVSDCLETLG